MSCGEIRGIHFFALRVINVCTQWYHTSRQLCNRRTQADDLLVALFFDIFLSSIVFLFWLGDAQHSCSTF